MYLKIMPSLLKNNFFTILLLASFGLFCNAKAQQNKLDLPRTLPSVVSNSPKEVIDQVWQIVYRDFLDSSGQFNKEDWKKLRKRLLAKQYVSPSESYDAIKGMLASLNDPYTRFLDPKEFNEMRIETSGELSGVGIRLSKDEDTKELIVVSPIDGTPAFKAGVKAQDVIISIDDKSTDGMTIQKAVKLIRGKEGSKVTLGLKRSQRVYKYELVRSRIEINSVISKLQATTSGLKFGYIRLKQFNANAPKEMKLAINDLEKMGAMGYLLDLRYNPGGLLEASIDIARQWLNEGTIVSTQTRTGIKDIRRANGSAITKLPVVVLVNEGSASASEILSGAIQENNRGILVGNKTFGKGLVQSVRALSDGSGLTVTIAKYLTPNGVDIHKSGIKPNIRVVMTDSEKMNFKVEDLATPRDRQYRKAESELIRSLRTLNNIRAYNPRRSNFQFALEAK